MAKSVLGHVTPLDLLKIRDSVAYDPTAPNGLRWRVKRMGRMASGPGQCFWIDQAHYQAPHVVMILNDRWPGDGDLVVTRVDKEGPWGVVENLRWAPRAEALAEGREHNRRKLLQKVFGDAVPDLGDRFRLASLCKRGHQWNGHPVTLRVRQGGCWRCLDCEKENDASPTAIATKQAWYEANKERLSKEATARAARRMAEDPEGELRKRKELRRRRVESGKVRQWKAAVRQRFLDQGLTTRGTERINGAPATALQKAIRAAGRSPSVARLVMNEQLRHWREHPSDRAAHDRRWAQASWWLEYQINPDMRLYHREKSKRRKAQNRGQTPVQIPVAALRQRFNEFGNCCAYCGTDGDMQIEHVEPISEGGAHDIGNIVPACGPCNTSKRISDMEDWYRSQPFFSELRLHQIRRVIRAPEGEQLALALA
jgi:5-methylcytosine-specific restriction endonuclease McrA